jgi:carotenoid cleavage dioxygenase
MAPLELVDPTTSPYLSGRFAPVHREITADDLAVEGSLPDQLVGAYVRNGPNPKFTPLGSYTFPMEGDGMLHGVWLEGGRARYRNRWVETAGLRAEERAGKALFGGLMTPAFVDPSLLGPDPDPGWPIKLDAFINIVRHGGRFLALEEGTPPYEVTPDLATVGRHDFAGALPDGLCAHPKVDPTTGEMVVFRYDVTEPFLTWAVIGADGTVTRPATAIQAVDRGFMVHDCAITGRYLVLFLGPAVFDLDAMAAGGPLLRWEPELGMRIALVPRDGVTPTRWIETDPFWVWHVANAYDDGSRVVVDYPRFNTLAFLDRDGLPGGRYTQAVLDPEAGTMQDTTIHDGISEFPRIDERLLGRRHRYVTVGAASGPALTSGEHDVLCRADLTTGAWETYETGATIGEVVFAPRPGGTDELDGWYLTFGTSLDDGHSALWVWDAGDFPGPPRARVRIPQRVPNGLHGNWFPAV